jgi:16S rRNA (cytosine967-C5)-methyltransferase
MTVVDLCAGAGGKTLALARRDMRGEGRLIAAGREQGSALARLPERAQRAGRRTSSKQLLLDAGKEAEALVASYGARRHRRCRADRCTLFRHWHVATQSRGALAPHARALEETRGESKGPHISILPSLLVKQGGTHGLCRLRIDTCRKAQSKA